MRPCAAANTARLAELIALELVPRLVRLAKHCEQPNLLISVLCADPAHRESDVNEDPTEGAVSCAKTMEAEAKN